MDAPYPTTSSNEREALSIPPPLPPKQDNAALPSIALDIPMSPVSPSSVDPASGTSRKYSPLTDLIESEKAYVDFLTGIIRKVAAAWSRSNLPPRELDVMFRSVEAVYKINRALLAKLKEIGESPSSPKALGDLLMRWIDELEQPYMTYADNYCIGFDEWAPVKSNAKLPIVLYAFSSANPPPSSLPQPTHLLDPSLWTLDALFLLPKGRLQYYRKLYSRLLKSTTPGKSDHRLLTGALGKLDALLTTLGDRTNISVASPQIAFPPPTGNSSPLNSAESPTDGPKGPASATTSTRGSLSSRDEHFSQETTSTSLSGKSSQALSSPVLVLEKRLATERTLDIFTMQPKQIRLQIAPPNLPYARELLLTEKVLVRFTPRATGVEVIHPHGHVYILSDLFLLCEEMPREERLARGGQEQDMHLCYPPLAGKVLHVAEVPGQANALQVSIMRKETLVLEGDSRITRDRILNEFQECISFSKTISRAAQEPIPSVPPIANFQLPVAQPENPSRKRPDRALNPRLLPQSQPGNVQSELFGDIAPIPDRDPTTSSPRQINGLPVKPTLPDLPQLEMTKESPRDLVSSPLSNPTSPRSEHGAHTLHNHGSSPMHPPRRSSAAYVNNCPPVSFAPGQIVPPMRSTSIQPQSPPLCTVPVPDFFGGPGGPISQNPTRQNPTLRHHTSMHSMRQRPLQHQPSLRSAPPRPNHPNFTAPHPQPAPRSSHEQPFPTHPSTAVASHPVEHTSRRLQKSLSSRSLHSQYQLNQNPLPPVPSLPDDLPMPRRPDNQRQDSMGSLDTPLSGPLLLPSMQMGSRSNSVMGPSILDPSPPTSPVQERRTLEPVRSVITAQMRCKVFHQQQHAQWKSLGSANLTLYNQEPTNVKQLVVESGNKKSILISMIVLTDGVERVGKTGVAIELSDAGGSRTGVIYMIQLRDEDSASGFFKSLLAGSDRAA